MPLTQTSHEWRIIVQRHDNDEVVTAKPSEEAARESFARITREDQPHVRRVFIEKREVGPWTVEATDA